MLNQFSLMCLLCCNGKNSSFHESRLQFHSNLIVNVLFLDNNYISWHFQAQKLLLRDGTLANFTIQSPSTLPTITLGLPANARVSIELQEMSIITALTSCMLPKM